VDPGADGPPAGAAAADEPQPPVALASSGPKGYLSFVTTEEPAPAPSGPAVEAGGLKRKNLIIIGVVTLAVWAFAIQTGSVILMSIVGVLTVALIGVLIWAFRMLRKQKNMASLLQGAASSPEARREAIAKLAAEKDSGDVVNVFARAQLTAADDPAAALKMLEPIDIKSVPAQMQDDVAILRAQLLLNFGRPKDARPLADSINVDSPQRKDARGMIASIVAEAWARTGRHQDALTLVDTVSLGKETEQIRAQLIVARTFAKFASGKRNAARDDLELLASMDINYLGKFVMPQFRVHPDLQKLARTVAEKNPQMRRMAKSQNPQRRGR